jgi:hypothetical protein
VKRLATWFAAATAALAVGAAFANPAAAASTPTIATSPAPTVDSVLAALTARADSVASYQARIQLAIQMHTFPFIAMTLNGKAAYQRPGKYTVTFDSVPELASAFQKVSGDIGDPSAWNQTYNISIDPSTKSAPPNSVVLRLVQKVHGQIDHALAHVDLHTDTVTRMEWYYYSGGKITMDQHFAPIDGVLLVDHQDAEIDMPGYKATTNAQFDGYTVQVSMTQPVTADH